MLAGKLTSTLGVTLAMTSAWCVTMKAVVVENEGALPSSRSLMKVEAALCHLVRVLVHQTLPTIDTPYCRSRSLIAASPEMPAICPLEVSKLLTLLSILYCSTVVRFARTLDICTFPRSQKLLSDTLNLSN